LLNARKIALFYIITKSPLSFSQSQQVAPKHLGVAKGHLFRVAGFLAGQDLFLI